MSLTSIAIFVIGSVVLLFVQNKLTKRVRKDAAKTYQDAVKEAKTAFDWQTFAPDECKTTLIDYFFPRWFFGRFVPRWRRLYVIQAYAHNRKTRALWGAKVLIKAGHNAGLSTYVPKNRNWGVGRYQRMVISKIVVGDNVSINHVSKMPDRKSFLALDTDDFRAQVRSRTKSAVEFDELSPGDFVLKLGLTKDAGVPSCVPLSAALRHLENYEAKSGKTLPPLSYCAVKFNWEYEILNLGGNTPHALAAGSTGGGKTIAMIQMDITFMLRNSPDAVKFIFVDMKRNAFKLYFENVPHQAAWFHEDALDVLAEAPASGAMANPLAVAKREKFDYKTFDTALAALYAKWSGSADDLAHRVATTEIDALLSLEFAQHEMNRRFWLFEHHRVKNVWNWNNRTPKGEIKLYLLIIQIDEVQVLTDGKSKLQKRVESILKDISARGREAGVLVCVGTQTPSSAVLPTSFRGNLDTRFAFPCDDPAQSRVIIGRESAAKMGAVPDGRALMKRSGKMNEVQIPFVADAEEPVTKWDKHVRTVMKGEPTIQARAAEIVTKWSGLDPRTTAIIETVQENGAWIIEQTSEYVISVMPSNELRKTLAHKHGFGGMGTVERHLLGLNNQKLDWEHGKIEIIPPSGHVPRQMKFVPCPLSHSKIDMAGGGGASPIASKEAIIQAKEGALNS